MRYRWWNKLLYFLVGGGYLILKAIIKILILNIIIKIVLNENINN